MDGFCIREYASKMRSVDVVKCWPLDETTCQETVRALLPPVTIKKFTYWLDELQDFHPKSAQKEEKVKSLGRKGKVRTPPKKRSIVDIFAAAPQVERVTASDSNSSSGEEEDENRVFSSKFSGHGKRNCNKKKNIEVIFSTLKRPKNIIKKTQKNVDKVDLSSPPNKKNSFKMKELQTQDKAIEAPNSSVGKDRDMDIHGCPSNDKRKLGQDHSDAADKRNMSYKTSEFVGENKNSTFPACGILRNHDEALSPKQSSQCISEETSFQVDNQTAANHVTRLENVDISNGTENFVSPDPRSPPVYFKEYLKRFDEPSVSNLPNSESSAAGNSHRRTLTYLSSEGLVNSVQSLPDRNQCSKVIIDSMGRDFVWLPLNSHGELMVSNIGNNQTMNSYNTLPNEFSTHPEHHCGTFLNADQVSFQSRSDITEMESYGIVDPELNLLKLKNDIFHSENSAGKDGKNAQSTVRLMGKELTINGSEFQGETDNGVIWKNKQVIEDIGYNKKCIGNVMEEPSLGTLGDNFISPLESRYSAPYFGSQTSSLMDRAEKSFLFSQHVPTGYQTTEKVFKQNFLHPNVFQQKNNQCLPPRPPIRFPFIHPDLEGHVLQPPCYNPTSCVFRPPLVFGVSEKEIPPIREFQTFSSFGCSHHPRVVPISGIQKMLGNQKKIRGQIMSRFARSCANQNKSQSQLSAGLSNVPFNLHDSGFHNASQCPNPWSTSCFDFQDPVRNEKVEQSIYHKMDTYGVTAMPGFFKLKDRVTNQETHFATTRMDTRF